MSPDLQDHSGTRWVCADEQGWESGAGAPPSGMFGLDKEELVSDNGVAAQSQGRTIRSGVSTRWEA